MIEYFFRSYFYENMNQQSFSGQVQPYFGKMMQALSRAKLTDQETPQLKKANLQVVWQAENIGAKVLLLVLSQKIIGSNAPTQAG